MSRICPAEKATLKRSRHLRWDTTPKLKQKLLLNIGDFCVALESAIVKNAKKSICLKFHPAVAMETIQDGRQTTNFKTHHHFF